MKTPAWLGAWSWMAAVSVCGAALLGACSEDKAATTTESTGGSATGGVTAAPAGGVATGGNTPAPTGGSTTGGAPSAGGNANGGAGAAPGASGAPPGGAGSSTGGAAAGGTPPASGGVSGAGAPSGGSAGARPMMPCPTPEEDLFSFFVISHDATIRESGSPDGFGGDLGGITGADAICQRVAEYSSPCQVNKVWHAFLSTTKEDAIDRIGKGPWHDRLGRLLANELSELLNDRPPNAAPEIIDDFPNEDGVPNMAPHGEFVDNHQILTGTGTNGRLYTQDPMAGAGGRSGGQAACGDGEEWTPEKATCWDWTSKEEQGCPRVGHSWPRQGSGINWISVWNEGGCAPGGRLVDEFPIRDGTRRVGVSGGYGGWYCFAVMNP